MTLFQNVPKLQNFAAKVAIGRLKKYDHVTPILKDLQWLTVQNKYTFEKCTTMYKAVFGIYPKWYLQFPTVRETTNATTRRLSDLHVPKTRTDSGARATTVFGPKIWNNLPSFIGNSGSLHIFKSKLRNPFS